MADAGPDFARLDDAHIGQAAVWSAHHLRDHGVARVRLTPGCGTRYTVMVAAPGREWQDGDEPEGSHYWVSWVNPADGGYEWTPGFTHPRYAAEHWVSPRLSKGEKAFTAEVLARFLTALSEAMGEG